MAADANDNIYVAGTIWEGEEANSRQSILLVKYDRQGQLQSANQYQNPLGSFIQLRNMGIDPADRVTLCGAVGSEEGDSDGLLLQYHPFPRGDVNGDGCVGNADLLAVLFAFGSSGGVEDIDHNGIVDDADLLLILFDFGTGC